MVPIGSFNNSNFYPNLNQKPNPSRELPVSTSSKDTNSKSSKVPGSSFLAQKGITPPPHNLWQPLQVRPPTLVVIWISASYLVYIHMITMKYRPPYLPNMPNILSISL
jgi:hypothetical protein